MKILRTLQTIVSIAIIPFLLLAWAIRFAVFAIIDGFSPRSPLCFWRKRR